ncbi:hypothetical protein [Mycobacterium sp. 852002-51057_SCH5723018]|uniref:hypothetical protein n=1 Tax=Mycobacterium sp. 852002-51057_SCH5723018 TaxID=1834094 RepID=UPI0007FCB552|nr:hypothetical protein [Mycobacterium sp. 852002-51057_SCH5723018]OBG28543.1 hypothetical protein A5764_25160 [Mycobacterium sp. 852002-51057_SCH5723018]
MSGWFDIWHNLSGGQGTVIGGTFVLVAGIISFGTGSLDRRSQQNRFHYEEMKALYAEALRVGRDMEVLKARSPEVRRELLTEKSDAVDRVISELALTGNYRTADLAIAYAYQQSVQLAEWVRQFEGDSGVVQRIDMWLDNMPEEQREALRKYENVAVDRLDVVQAARRELGLYVPIWSRYRRVLRGAIKTEPLPLS